MSDTTTTTTTTGQCLCGKVRVTVTGKPLTSFPTLTCHCISCKRRSGGIASYAFVVPKEYVRFHPEPLASSPLGGGSNDDDNPTTTTTTTTSSSPSGKYQQALHKVFIDKDTGSGHPMQRTMCAECGSPVCIVEASDPDARCLQFGLFAGVEGLLDQSKPRLEMFARRRVRWIPEVGEDVREEA